MGKTTIEWTATYNDDGTVSPGYTFNPWQGCIKISPGCQHCYAETLSNRWGKDIWGPGSKRERTSAANWRKPLQWNKQAEKEGRRYKVFCASMADVFERNDQLIDWRFELWGLIGQTPNLDWLLLTKRPENILDMTPYQWHTPEWGGYQGWPANVWLGTSVENQEYADKRIPELLRIPAAVRFLSVEPLLGPVNLMKYLLSGAHKWRQDINWVIVGGESGHGARPMHPEWVRKIRDDCQAAGVAYFFKQWGQMRYWEHGTHTENKVTVPIWRCSDGETRKHDPWDQFGGWQWDKANRLDRNLYSEIVGKHTAGRLLDGRTWDEFPVVEADPAAT